MERPNEEMVNVVTGRPQMLDEPPLDYDHDFGDHNDDQALLGETVVEQETCFFRYFVFGCSDVAASNHRIKVRGQGLSGFPRVIRMVPVLENVTLMDFSNNNIVEIPSWISQMSGLRKLFLSNNDISTVNPELYALTQLTHLALDNNRISYLNRDVLDLSELRSLLLANNPIGWPPVRSAFEVCA